jgi:NAD(P)-dependent dehydrogenase (short-subunit alcohol dehydrogenase family)
MWTNGWGRIVFVATVGATRPGTGIPEYYAAKGALPSIAVSLGKHVAGSGITVNCVSPGVIATPEIVEQFTERARREGRGTDWPSVERVILEGMPNPSGHVPSPEDVGRFVAYVVSEPAWHLNGAHLRFDGGAAGVVT